MDLGHPCPAEVQVPGKFGGTVAAPCPTRLQPVTFEGHQSLAAGIAAHLQTVHGWSLQTAWRVANGTAVRAGQE